MKTSSRCARVSKQVRQSACLCCWAAAFCMGPLMACTATEVKHARWRSSSSPTLPNPANAHVCSGTATGTAVVSDRAPAPSLRWTAAAASAAAQGSAQCLPPYPPAPKLLAVYQHLENHTNTDPNPEEQQQSLGRPRPPSNHSELALNALDGQGGSGMRVTGGSPGPATARACCAAAPGTPA